jgi:hypothetical protein
MCIFVVLCVDETLFYMREYSDAIKLNFWLAKEVNEELKKELMHQCL